MPKQKPPFNVITQINDFSQFSVSNEGTKHFSEKGERLSKYLPYLRGLPINGFIVERASGVGLEAHILLETGLILIFGVSNRKLITAINPQCYQVTRYFKALNKPMMPADYTAMEHSVYRNDALGWKEDDRDFKEV